MNKQPIEYTNDELHARMDDFNLSPRMKEFIFQSIALHSHFAPGLLIGALMVDFALDILHATPADELFAISETQKCAPDAIQAILHCTIGNNRLNIIPSGRFAIVLTRRTTTPEAKGVRISINKKMLDSYPILRSWFMNEPEFDKWTMNKQVTDEIFAAGRNVLSQEQVIIPVFPKKKWTPVLCQKCHEVVPDFMIENFVCKACNDLIYYRKTE